jgi:O-antigen ligase
MDAAWMFGLMICLLTLIPSLTILPNTSADIGRPAVVLCVLMFCWWVASRCHPRLAMLGPQPIRWAVLIYLLSVFASYAVGYERGLTGMEANAADRDLIAIAAFVGVMLLAADGLSNWNRLRVVLHVFVWCSAFMAIVGVLQEILPINVVEYMSIPGLRTLSVVPLQARGSGVRVPSTTTHYLELSGTLALAWPIAIHLMTFARTVRQRRRYLLATLLITLGILETISRSGIVAIVIGALILMPLWSWRKRYNTVVLGVGMFGVLSAVTPSLARTLFNMFADANLDPSITARTDRYQMVGYFFAQRPWLGRGTGTWVPPMYQYLDNQWFRTALESGLVGVGALATLHLTALGLAAIAFRRSNNAEDRHLCLALVAVQVIAMFTAYTFDVLSYSTYATALGVLIGMCGTVWRFTHPARAIRTSTPHWFGP